MPADRRPTQAERLAELGALIRTLSEEVRTLRTEVRMLPVLVSRVEAVETRTERTEVILHRGNGSPSMSTVLAETRGTIDRLERSIEEVRMTLQTERAQTVRAIEAANARRAAMITALWAAAIGAGATVIAAVLGLFKG